MRPDKRSTAYLPGLDGWRAIAVCAVVLDHARPLSQPRLQHHLQNHGEQAVWLFFAISGLLICSRLLDEESRYGTISLRNFYVRRAFRILPAALVYLAVIAALGAIRVLPFAASPWMAALLFYRNYWSYFHPIASVGSWFTGHFWSLSVEEHFYLILPGILVLFPKRRALALGTMAAICVAWLVVFLAREPSSVPNDFWSQRTEFCLIGLIAGALFALAAQKAGVRQWAERNLHPWLLVAALVVMTWFDSAYGGNTRSGVQLLLRAILHPLLLLATILHPASAVTRLLETAPMRFLGRISYSLYLWQSLFLVRTNVFRSPIDTVQTRWLGVACAVACAIASYYLVETPLIRFGRRFATQRQSPSPLHEG